MNPPKRVGPGRAGGQGARADCDVAEGCVDDAGDGDGVGMGMGMAETVFLTPRCWKESAVGGGGGVIFKCSEGQYDRRIKR